MKKWAYLLLPLIFGCANVADIRSMPANRIMESTLPSEQIAACVMFNAPAAVKGALVNYYQFTLSENPKGTFHILASLTDQPMGEADFKPIENSGTLIELRSRWNFWGSDSFWNCIQQCAAPQNAP